MSDCIRQDQTQIVLKHLRRQGHAISTEMVAKPRTRYAIYRLAK